MFERIFILLGTLWLASGSFSSAFAGDLDEPTSNDEAVAAAPATDGGKNFYVIPVQDAIGQPTLFAIRNGVKRAIEIEADILFLDMDTPGGELGSTLEIMKILEKFPRKVVTYVNKDAVSAGSFIAASTNEIWFSKDGVMGAAAPISGGGEDINETLKKKIVSYLKARIRSLSEDYRYRGAVVSAMIDEDFELTIEGKEIKKKGELLSLTASEAIELYGDPPESLLGAGISNSLESLLESLAEGDPYNSENFESTWSLDLAHFLVKLAPILFAAGIMTVYIEMQTPGFGIPGIIGVCCFIIAMFGHHVAGLSGQEPMLIFFIGAVLLFLEIFFMPGAFVLAVPGVLLMIGSLIWSMTDVWPENTPEFEWELAMFQRPLLNLFLGFALGIVSIAALARFLPRSMIWDRMILSKAIDGSTQTRKPRDASKGDSLVGAIGIAATDLYPGGEIEVDGKRYQAHCSTGMLDRGTSVRVLSCAQFGYEVEEVET